MRDSKKRVVFFGFGLSRIPGELGKAGPILAEKGSFWQRIVA
jgi:hypothetical protein